MEEFDQNLTLTLDVYLKYLQMFVTMIQSADSALLTVSSSSTKSLLEEEWTFVKQVSVTTEICFILRSRFGEVCSCCS